MGNFLPDGERQVMLLGLERAGKTHMLYTRIVGEGGMHTIKQLKETQGFNFEHVEQAHANLNVWDIGGSPVLRKSWTQLYLKNVPVSAIVYVVNISE